MPKITRQKMTVAIVKGMTCPAGAKEAHFWDDEVRGLGLRIYANGKRSWLYMYNNADGRRLRVTLKAADLATARTEAGKLSRRVAVGGDPQVEAQARRAAETVAEVIELYLPRAELRQGARTFVEVKRALNVNAKPLHPLKAGSVKRQDIVGLLNDIAAKSGGTSANRVRSYLSAMWTWALKEGLVEGSNPIANTNRPVDEKPRERVLADHELALIWRCTAGTGDYHRGVRLLMLTATRLTEVGGMLVSELDRLTPAFVISADRTKNGLPHEVPLTPLAVEQLPTTNTNQAAVFGLYGTGFSGWSKSKERLDKHMLAALVKDFTTAHGREPGEAEVVLTPWRHHDLRRTFSTWANESGIEPHVVEAVLNHVSGSARRGVAGVYNRAVYRVQKRDALSAWEGHLRSVCGLPAAG